MVNLVPKNNKNQSMFVPFFFNPSQQSYHFDAVLGSTTKKNCQTSGQYFFGEENTK